MPRSQTANVGVYDLAAVVSAGAPGDVVAVFQQRDGHGAILTITAENAEGDNDVDLSYEVSDDGTNFQALTAAANGVVVTNVTLTRKHKLDHRVILRPSEQFNEAAAAGTYRAGDKYFRVRATGGARFQLQIRGDEALQRFNLVKGVATIP